MITAFSPDSVGFTPSVGLSDDHDMLEHVQEIAAGGFSLVSSVRYKGELVACKMLRNGTGKKNALRFMREVRIQKGLRHKNIVPILYSWGGPKDKSLGYLMPLARCNLRRELSQLKRNTKRALLVFQQILDGVEHAHKSGVIHRDLKPENILFFKKGEIKIADFGLGKRYERDSIAVTSSSEWVGSAPYMPPEQYVKFKHLGVPADIFALGKILYELLTGEHPQHVDLGHPGLAAGFSEIVKTCLHPFPEARYQTIDTLRTELLYITKRYSFADISLNQIIAFLNKFLNSENTDYRCLAEIDCILTSNQNSSELFLHAFPEFSDEFWRAYHEFKPDSFVRRLLHYDRFVDIAENNDTYFDRKFITNEYSGVFLTCKNNQIRLVVFKRLLQVFVKTSDPNLAGQIGHILGTVKTRTEANAVTELLRQNFRAAAVIYNYTPHEKAHSMIGKTLRWCKQILQKSQVTAAPGRKRYRPL